MQSKETAGAAIERLLNSRMSSYVGEKMVRTTSMSLAMSLYSVVHGTLAEVLPEAGVSISNDAMNMAAQMLYDLIEVNGQTLPEDIFTRRVWPCDVPTHELALLAIVFKSSPIGKALYAEIKRRS